MTVLCLGSAAYLIAPAIVADAAPAPVTYTVTGTGDAGGSCSASGTGTSSCTTLRAAVVAADAQAGAAVTIEFAASADGTIALNSELTVDGPARVSIQGNGATSTILSGQGTTRVLQMTGTTDLTLDKLTVTRGHAPDGTAGGLNSGDGGDGGAINATGSGAITITNSTLSSNSAGDGGDGGESVITGGGGGPGGDGGDGGALNATGPVTITNSTFSSNDAGTGGNGGDSDESIGGRGGSGGNGGALNTTGPVTITNSTFSSNDAGTGGNGGDSGNSPLGTYTGGTGGSGGNGGALNTTGPVTITNSTFSSNDAGNGGDGGKGGNGGNEGADGGGGGVAGGGAVTVAGSILAGGTPQSCAGQVTDGGHNLEYTPGAQSSSCGFTAADDVTGQDPLLEPLADNGGPTETQALGAGSPAIGAGGDCTTATDQRGVPRVHPCDIGAYETRAVQAPLAVTSTSGVFGTPLVLTTSGGSGDGEVTFTAVDSTATGCAVSTSTPFTLTANRAGSCTVTAHKAAGSGYAAADSAPTPVTLSPIGTIVELYRAILGRNPDPAGRAYWTARLNDGVASADVARSIAATPEAVRHDIAVDYNQALARNPDPGGLTYWAAALGASHTPHVALARLQASHEAFTNAGATDQGYVAAVYQQLLGRTPPPDSGGLAYWTGRLDQGQARAQIALAIALSSEASRHAATSATTLVCTTPPNQTASLAAAYRRPNTGPSLLRGLAALQPGCTVTRPITPPPL